LFSGKCSASRNAQEILVLKHDGKRSLNGDRNRWVDDVKMNVKHLWCDGVGLIEMAQGRV
jgi:hypothetical protein